MRPVFYYAASILPHTDAMLSVIHTSNIPKSNYNVPFNYLCLRVMVDVVDITGAYPYATCFVCKEMGHISRDCLSNDNGLYPNGGCCLECGSVRHFRKDCPEKQKKQGTSQAHLNSFLHVDSLRLSLITK